MADFYLNSKLYKINLPTTAVVLESGKVKVFPCSRRGTVAADSPIDPESRLQTEYNNTIRSAIGAYQNSFLEVWNTDLLSTQNPLDADEFRHTQNNVLKFVLNGYHFEVNLDCDYKEDADSKDYYYLSSEDAPTQLTTQGALKVFCDALKASFELSSFETGMSLYAAIKLEKAAITVGETNTHNTPVLAHLKTQDPNSTYLDLQLDGTYFFNGLCFYIANTELSAPDIYNLKLAEYSDVFGWDFIHGGVMEAVLVQATDGDDNFDFKLKLSTNQRRTQDTCTIASDESDEEVFIEYKYDSDKKATVLGLAQQPVNYYDLIIPAAIEIDGIDDVTFTVVAIASNAFENDTQLKKLVIQAPGITIGEDAFKDCTSLLEIELPSNAVIDETAFSGCINVLKVTEIVTETPSSEAPLMPVS